MKSITLTHKQQLDLLILIGRQLDWIISYEGENAGEDTALTRNDFSIYVKKCSIGYGCEVYFGREKIHHSYCSKISNLLEDLHVITLINSFNYLES